jgi:hypothetical protein
VELSCCLCLAVCTPRRLKPVLVEPEETTVSRQRLSKHCPAAVSTVLLFCASRVSCERKVGGQFMAERLAIGSAAAVWSLCNNSDSSWPVLSDGRLCTQRQLDMLCKPVEVNLRPTVSRPVCLGVRRPSGNFDQFSFLLEIPFRQFHVCYFVAPYLTRGRVCNFL